MEPILHLVLSATHSFNKYLSKFHYIQSILQSDKIQWLNFSKIKEKEVTSTWRRYS